MEVGRTCGRLGMKSEDGLGPGRGIASLRGGGGRAGGTVTLEGTGPLRAVDELDEEAVDGGLGMTGRTTDFGVVRMILSRGGGAESMGCARSLDEPAVNRSEKRGCPAAGDGSGLATTPGPVWAMRASFLVCIMALSNSDAEAGPPAFLTFFLGAATIGACEKTALRLPFSSRLCWVRSRKR